MELKTQTTTAGCARVRVSRSGPVLATSFPTLSTITTAPAPPAAECGRVDRSLAFAPSGERNATRAVRSPNVKPPRQHARHPHVIIYLRPVMGGGATRHGMSQSLPRKGDGGGTTAGRWKVRATTIKMPDSSSTTRSKTISVPAALGCSRLQRIGLYLHQQVRVDESAHLMSMDIDG